MKFLRAKFWGLLVYLSGIVLFVITVPPAISYIVDTFGRTNVVVVISLALIFGSLNVIFYTSIATARYVNKRGG